MAVISGTDYRNIAVSYSNALLRVEDASGDLFDAVYDIVMLQAIDPEIDLLMQFYSAYQINTSILSAKSTYISTVATLQNHVLSRGHFVNVDAYLDDQLITVPRKWAELSALAGFPISNSNIDP